MIRLEGSEFAVIGLFEQHTTSQRERGAPFLKDVPTLGWLFRLTDDSETVSRMMLAVSARVEKTSAQAETASIRRQLVAERQRSRNAALGLAGDEAFAVRAATRRVEDDARSIAHALRARGENASVVARQLDGAELFDVYLRGFDSLADATGASLRLAGPLYDPEIVALPERDPRLAGIRPAPAAAP